MEARARPVRFFGCLADFSDFVGAVSCLACKQPRVCVEGTMCPLNLFPQWKAKFESSTLPLFHLAKEIIHAQVSRRHHWRHIPYRLGRGGSSPDADLLMPETAGAGRRFSLLVATLFLGLLLALANRATAQADLSGAVTGSIPEIHIHTKGRSRLFFRQGQNERSMTSSILRPSRMQFEMPSLWRKGRS